MSSSPDSSVIKRLLVEGWCILRGLISADVVGAIREQVIEQTKRQDKDWKAVYSEMIAGGKQVPPSGVGHAQGLINHVPLLAHVVADRRLLDAAEALLGPFVRVSSMSGLVNHPGTERGYWHSDWPFNMGLAAHVEAPYRDIPMQLSAIGMLTDFTPENGATLIVPGSHAFSSNPTAEREVERYRPHPREIQLTGSAGDMIIYDSRLWHAVPPNTTQKARVAVTIRYSPWWLNLEVRRKGSPDYERVVRGSSGKDNSIPLVERAVFDALPESTKPLFMHWVGT